jgi:hypothetical protein
LRCTAHYAKFFYFYANGYSRAIDNHQFILVCYLPNGNKFASFIGNINCFYTFPPTFRYTVVIDR